MSDTNDRPHVVMTLLVRDEVDIVRDTLEYHLASGVSHVLAVDNGSVDGTREILAEYAKAGVLTLIDEPGRDYSQHRWVTRAATVAREEHAAEWILNGDADEFWWTDGGDLRAPLASASTTMLVCRRRNMLYPCDESTGAHAVTRCMHRVAQSLRVPHLVEFYEDPLAYPYYYFDLPEKALVRAQGLTQVSQGNHDAHYSGPVTRSVSEIWVYHYPVRSAAQFERKVLQGGAAYANNTELDERVGWHWRRWHRMIQREGVQRTLADAMPTREQLERDVQSGLLLEDRTLRDRFEGRTGAPGAPALGVEPASDGSSEG